MILNTEQIVTLSKLDGIEAVRQTMDAPLGTFRLFRTPSYDSSLRDVLIYIQPDFARMNDPSERRKVFAQQMHCQINQLDFLEIPFYTTFESLKHYIVLALKSRSLPRPVQVTKIFKLAYGHRLHNPRMSDEENCVVYGACNRSHGHNMQLEVTVEGWTNPTTGMVINFNELKRIVNEVVVDKLDHQWLNDVYGEDALTTCEVTTPLIMQSLIDVLPIERKVRVFETDSSFCELTR